MAVIIAPNNKYNGESAGVHFRNGMGITDNQRAIEWFKEKGYEVREDVDAVDEEDIKNDLNSKTVEELKAMCEEQGIEIPKKATKKEIIEMIINNLDKESEADAKEEETSEKQGE